MTRLKFCVLFALAVVLQAVTFSGTASAQNVNGLFGWQKFNNAQGNPADYPEWRAHPVQPGPAITKVFLKDSIADYSLTTGYTLNRATLRVYKPGAVPNSWLAVATLRSHTAINQAATP